MIKILYLSESSWYQGASCASPAQTIQHGCHKFPARIMKSCITSSTNPTKPPYTTTSTSYQQTAKSLMSMSCEKRRKVIMKVQFSGWPSQPLGRLVGWVARSTGCLRLHGPTHTGWLVRVQAHCTTGPRQCTVQT